jgi:hypothetical protein
MNVRRKGRDLTYNAFAITPYADETGLGTAKPDRIARVKKNPKYQNMGDDEISEILRLGAVRNGNFGVKITDAERNALKQVATRHAIKFSPDLNAEKTAQMYIQRQLERAQRNKDDKAIAT